MPMFTLATNGRGRDLRVSTPCIKFSNHESIVRVLRDVFHFRPFPLFLFSRTMLSTESFFPESFALLYVALLGLVGPWDLPHFSLFPPERERLRRHSFLFSLKRVLCKMAWTHFWHSRGRCFVFLAHFRCCHAPTFQPISLTAQCRTVRASENLDNHVTTHVSTMTLTRLSFFKFNKDRVLRVEA